MENQPASSNSESKQNELLERALNNIMTVEEYSEIRHQTPYVFELKFGDKELFYFGAPHINNLENPVFKEIEAAFNKANPDIVLVEGIHVWRDITRFNARIKEASFENVVEKMGEPGFTIKIALENNREWLCPEPSDKDLYADLLEYGFSKEEIFAWYIFNILPQFSRKTNRGDFEQYLHEYIKAFRESTGWENFSYTLDNALQVGEQILGRKINVENESVPKDLTDPIPWEGKKHKQTVLNDISKVASNFRDRKIVTAIVEVFEKYNHVFVVYGSSHAAMQEPALKTIFNS